MSKMTRTLAVLVSVAAPLAPASAVAQAFPDKPVTFVVPNSAGSPIDLLVRVIAPGMARELGQPVLVLNKPGASQTIGLEFVAKQSKPDGYTITAASMPSVVILPYALKELRFDPMKDLPPALALVQGEYVFASSVTLPWKTLDDYVAGAKASPGKLTFGSGSASIRFPIEMVAKDKGIKLTHIPYNSGTATVNAMISGEVDGVLMNDVAVVGQGEKLRFLAVTGGPRNPNFPGTPTFAELGYPQMPSSTFAMNVPPGTPAPIVEKLRAAGTAALKDPAANKTLTGMLLNPVFEAQAVTEKRLVDLNTLYAQVAKDIGFKPE